jgi:cytochrome c biogenesis protein CcdA
MLNAGSVGLALLAGLLSVLSPCVLPMLPLVFGGAAARGRLEPILLALGVAVSFVAIGMFVATIGYSIGLDESAFRVVAAALTVGVGAILLLPALQTKVVAALGPLGDRIDGAFRGAPILRALGPFGLGLTLGAVWSPCAGPTLGAASLLASRGENLREAAAIMAAFGVGAAVPLLVLGLLSREFFARWRGSLLGAGVWAKQALGAFLILLGALTLTGRDKPLEAAFVDASPQWLTSLTTRY